MDWQFNGIPLHPFFVHIVVVIVPLSTIAVVLHAWWPAARRRLGWVTPALGIAAFGSTVLAKEAGDWLAAHTKDTTLLEAHTRIGAQLLPWAGLLLVVSVAEWVWFGWFLPRHEIAARTRTGVVVAFVAAAVVIAVGANLWLFLIGDSGARAVWVH